MRLASPTTVLAAVLAASPANAGGDEPRLLPAADGYQGIWYMNQPTGDEFRYKYSGGFATYPQQHVPIAVYAAGADKTFFVYGGTTDRDNGDGRSLLHLVSYFDHRTGTVPRPRILLDKETDDAHDHPVLQIDDGGHLWVFSASHGTSRPSYIHRSAEPWSIERFERVTTTNFSYPQPWHVPGRGFLFLHTRYGGGKPFGVGAARCLFTQTSADGTAWGEPRFLAGIDKGDYQISWRSGDRVATAFDYHPSPVGLNARSNIYYLETRDFGQTWTDATGSPAGLPVTRPDHPALAFDSRSRGELVYLKDLGFDREGNPVILFLTSRGYEPGPGNGPRRWFTTRWTGSTWQTHPLTTSDNNYDHGSLYLEPDGTWRVIAPTTTGPQPFNPGGEMAMWTSPDQGATWSQVRQLTSDSESNHTYARRPLHAHPGFYALWADGHGRRPSSSALYFTDRDGTAVWKLPDHMEGESARPERLAPGGR